MVDFNYEYVLLEGSPERREAVSLDLGGSLVLNCRFVKEMGENGRRLYQVDGWKEIAANPHLERQLLSWLGCTAEETRKPVMV